MTLLRYIVPVLLMWGISTSAQRVELPVEYVRNEMFGENHVGEKVKGTPYGNEAFQPGVVEFGGKTITAKLRYNRLRDHFELKNTTGEIGILKRSRDIAISIGKDNYRFFDYFNKDDEKIQGYLKVLVDDERKFLKKEGAELRSAVKARTSYGQDKPAEIVPFEEYYVMLSGEAPKHIRLKKRDILEVLGENKVKDYVREKDLDLKEERDVVRLILYLNSLK